MHRNNSHKQCNAATLGKSGTIATSGVVEWVTDDGPAAYRVHRDTCGLQQHVQHCELQLKQQHQEWLSYLNHT